MRTPQVQGVLPGRCSSVFLFLILKEVTEGEGTIFAEKRNNAEWLQQTQIVTVGPVLDALAVSDTEDLDLRRGDLFACSWNAHEVALVGATKRLANHDSISFRDHLLNGETAIGEGCEELRDELFGGFSTLDR